MIRQLIKKGALLLGGDFVLRKINKTPRVLFWHGVDIHPDPLVEAESISKKDFLKQVYYLKKHYEIISIDEFYHRYMNNSFSNKEILLTFDDGYKNNLTVLAPILKSLQIPFTVFISTQNISEGNLFPTSIVRLVVFGSTLKQIDLPSKKKVFSIGKLIDKKNTSIELNRILKTSNIKTVELLCQDLIDNVSIAEWGTLKERYNSLLPLTWAEVRKLKTYGCTIGSHCIDHICCHSNQDKDEIKTQIISSKKIIEQEIREPCNYFAYPNGDYTEYSNKIVAEAGYLLGFTTKNIKVVADEKQFQTIPRISIPFNFDTFKIFINLYPKK